MIGIILSTFLFYRAEISTTFTPPHNEPIVHNYVARYKLEGDTGLKIYDRFFIEGNFKYWGLQDWRTPDQVGHGFPDAWRGSDWKVKEWKFDYLWKAGMNVYGPVQVFVEHSVADDYYWMTGIRVKLK